jgi:hypothetical protein
MLRFALAIVIVLLVLPMAARAQSHGTAQEPLRRGAVRAPEAPLPGEALEIAPPAPTGLTSTTDESICAAHGGFGEGLGCHASLPLGELVLVWDWTGPHAIDGFLVYRVDGGRHERIAQTPAKKADAILTEGAANYAGRCYVVTAFHGPNESAPSASFCATDRDYLKTVVLWAENQATVQRSVGKGVDADWDDVSRQKGAAVGFLYDTYKNPVVGDNAYVSVFRFAVKFDLSRIDGREIRAAQLKLSVDSTWFFVKQAVFPDASTPASDHVSSCVAKIALGQDSWWTRSDWIDGPVVSQPSPEAGPIQLVDVTPQVRGWVTTGSPNYGFLLEGSEENFNAFTEHGCLTQYDAVQLVVVYR